MTKTDSVGDAARRRRKTTILLPVRVFCTQHTFQRHLCQHLAGSKFNVTFNLFNPEAGGTGHPPQTPQRILKKKNPFTPISQRKGEYLSDYNTFLVLWGGGGRGLAPWYGPWSIVSKGNAKPNFEFPQLLVLIQRLCVLMTSLCACSINRSSKAVSPLCCRQAAVDSRCHLVMHFCRNNLGVSIVRVEKKFIKTCRLYNEKSIILGNLFKEDHRGKETINNTII
jgi:hypothetical protein